MEYAKYQKGFKFIKSNDDIIIRDIKEYFEEPKIYLKQNKRIIIGKSLLKNLQNFQLHVVIKSVQNYLL